MNEFIVERLSSQDLSWPLWALPMPTLIATTVAETLQRAVALHHALSLVDEVLALSVEPMMKWLDMDVEASEEESVIST